MPRGRVVRRSANHAPLRWNLGTTSCRAERCAKHRREMIPAQSARSTDIRLHVLGCQFRRVGLWGVGQVRLQLRGELHRSRGAIFSSLGPKNVADDGIAYQPCPFRDFQHAIFAPAIFGPKFITNQSKFDNNFPRWPLQSRSRPQKVLICFLKVAPSKSFVVCECASSKLS